jgi:hypothetical protein
MPVRPGPVWVTHASSLVGGTAISRRSPPATHVTWRDPLSRHLVLHNVMPATASRRGNRSRPKGRYYWPTRLLLAGPGPPTASGSRLTMAEHVRRCEVIPGTTLTDLDHVDLELCIFSSHFVQFWPALDAAFIPAEFVPVDVRDVRELRLSADRTRGVGPLAVELRRPQKVWMRIANISHSGAPREHRGERRPAGQPVVDHRSPHARQVTTELAGTGDPTGHRPLLRVPGQGSRRARIGADLRRSKPARIVRMYQLDTSARHAEVIHS